MLRARSNLTILTLLASSLLLGCGPRGSASDAAKAGRYEDEIEYTRELVERKAGDEFPGEDTPRVMTILDQYGVRPHERERERVQLAILKLSGGKLEELQKQVEVAKKDYRDVLLYAEYPLWAESPLPMEDTKEAKEMDEKNRKQYLDWLNGKPGQVRGH